MGRRDLNATTSLFWIISAALGVAGLSGAIDGAATGPDQRYWAFRLASSLPLPLSIASSVALVSLASPGVRRAVTLRLEAADDLLRIRLGPAGNWALGISLAIIFYVFRERALYGDGLLLLLSSEGGQLFHGPDFGATLSIGILANAARAVDVAPLPTIQLFVSGLGGLFFILLLRLARRISTPAPRLGVIVVIVLGGGGLLRLYAGHVESYPILLPPVALAISTMLERVDGGRSSVAAALWLGLALWVHASALLLVPALLYVEWRRRVPGDSRRNMKTAVTMSIGLAATWVVCIVLVVLTGRLEPMLETMIPQLADILGLADPADQRRWWLFQTSGSRELGLAIAFGSPAHLDYLLNAFFLLAPALLPLAVVALGIEILGKRPADPTTETLLALAAPTWVYALVLRPFWGPFDWDLFCLTTLCSSLLAVRVWVVGLPHAVCRDALTYAAGATLLCVGLPLLALNGVEHRIPGPLTDPPRIPAPELFVPAEDPRGPLDPWGRAQPRPPSPRR